MEGGKANLPLPSAFCVRAGRSTTRSRKTCSGACIDPMAAPIAGPRRNNCTVPARLAPFSSMPHARYAGTAVIAAPAAAPLTTRDHRRVPAGSRTVTRTIVGARDDADSGSFVQRDGRGRHAFDFAAPQPVVLLNQHDARTRSKRLDRGPIGRNDPRRRLMSPDAPRIQLGSRALSASPAVSRAPPRTKARALCHLAQRLIRQTHDVDSTDASAPSSVRDRRPGRRARRLTARAAGRRRRRAPRADRPHLHPEARTPRRGSVRRGGCPTERPTRSSSAARGARRSPATTRPPGRGASWRRRSSTSTTTRGRRTAGAS